MWRDFTNTAFKTAVCCCLSGAWRLGCYNVPAVLNIHAVPERQPDDGRGPEPREPINSAGFLPDSATRPKTSETYSRSWRSPDSLQSCLRRVSYTRRKTASLRPALGGAIDCSRGWPGSCIVLQPCLTSKPARERLGGSSRGVRRVAPRIRLAISESGSIKPWDT